MAPGVKFRPIYVFILEIVFAGCPSGLTASVDGASCLKLGTRKTNWNNANQDCKDLGGQLVSVGSAERNNEVSYQRMKRHSFLENNLAN